MIACNDFCILGRFKGNDHEEAVSWQVKAFVRSSFMGAVFTIKKQHECLREVASIAGSWNNFSLHPVLCFEVLLWG